MSFVVDTDICSAYLRGEAKTYNKFVQHGGGIFVSTITVTELFTWVSRKNAAAARRTALIKMLSNVSVLDLDYSTAEFTGQLRGSLLDVGITVPPADLINGTTALLNNFTMVTHNVRDYALIPNLRIQDWLI